VDRGKCDGGVSGEWFVLQCHAGRGTDQHHDDDIHDLHHVYQHDVDDLHKHDIDDEHHESGVSGGDDDHDHTAHDADHGDTCHPGRTDQNASSSQLAFAGVGALLRWLIFLGGVMVLAATFIRWRLTRHAKFDQP
jgi:hypothetical protein